MRITGWFGVSYTKPGRKSGGEGSSARFSLPFGRETSGSKERALRNNSQSINRLYRNNFSG